MMPKVKVDALALRDDTPAEPGRLVAEARRRLGETSPLAKTGT
jgi:hypothetical protein